MKQMLARPCFLEVSQILTILKLLLQKKLFKKHITYKKMFIIPEN